MLSSIEQISETSKANREARLALCNALTQTAFDSATRLVELNLNAAKAALAESAVYTQQILSAKDAQEVCGVAVGHARPGGEKAFSYGRHVAGIASVMQAECSQAVQATIAETQRNMMALAEEFFKKAPAASESAVALVKSALGNASAGVELFTKGTQQAVAVLDEHLATAANQASQAAETNLKSAARK